MNETTTLTGLTLAEAGAMLDDELPASAYKPVPGGADLTDINPNHMRRVLNDVFGLCGHGWGYKYSPDNVHTRSEVRVNKYGKERTVIIAVVKYLEFWYKLQNGSALENCTVPATGSSENSNDAYALKGALTNAIGNAASNIGFQTSVYLGVRSHKTVGRKPAPRKPAPRKPAPRPALKPRVTVPAPVMDIEDLDAPEPSAPTDGNGYHDLGSFVIPIGKNEGKKLSEVTHKAVRWYAETMSSAKTSAGRELQNAARAYLEVLPAIAA